MSLGLYYPIKTRQTRLQLLGSVAWLSLVSLAVCLPLFQVNWFENHDMAAYPVRALEYVRGWRAGYVIPRWAPDLYGGYGAPLFNFYSPFLFVVSGLFMLAGASATLGLKLALVAFTGAGAVGTFGLVRGETRRIDAAVLAATVFVAMPYRLTQIYTRGDLAEYAAISLVPLSLWCYRALLRAPEQKVISRAIAAAATQSVVLLTHTITGLFQVELLAILLGIWGWTRWQARERKRVLTLAVTWASANGLCSFYAFPALLERGAVQIQRMTGGMFVTENNTVELTALISAAKHGGFYYVGLATIASVVCVPLVTWSLRGMPSVRGLRRSHALLLALLLVLLPPAGPLWTVVPFSAFIQFPWRLLGFVAVFGGLTTGLAWAATLRPFDRRLLFPLALLSACVAFDGLRVRPAIANMDASRVPETAEEIARQLHSTVVSDEYLPVGAVKPGRPRSGFILFSDSVQVESSLQRGVGYRIVLHATRPAALDVQTFWFPGWNVVTEAGPSAATVGAAPGGALRISLPEPGPYRLSLRFGLSPLRLASTLLSWLVLVLFLGYLMRAHGRWRAS